MRLPILLSPILSLCLFAGAGLPARAQTETIPTETISTETAPPAIQNEEAREMPPLPVQNARNKADNQTARNAGRRAQIEMRLRAMMSDFGVDEAAQQDAVIAYLAEDEAGKSTVRDVARRLIVAVRNGATPERTRDLIAVYKASLDADKERRRAAQGTLDAKIGFSLNPRLEATLWLFGVLGEGQAGLPLNVLAPRNANGRRRNAPDDRTNNNKQPGPGAQRTGIVTGIVTRKGEGWIEVRDENAGMVRTGGADSIERYLPFWTANESAPQNAKDERDDNVNGDYDRSVLEAMKAVQVGERVRLEWVWNERKRVVRLSTAPPDAAPQNAPAQPLYPANNP
ncbi:hypothetical protein B1R32_104135 [Abditibacterium utsteinense]|uniref:Uncharacterized protein n=2 Tax=Abditibacterium utsteinense TaxID=1960156 RepID=A0A2S8SV23_9BACT|nr:hypothetical protein B1R32_104135 [Abditibacterium utsteinense]